MQQQLPLYRLAEQCGAEVCQARLPHDSAPLEVKDYKGLWTPTKMTGRWHFPTAIEFVDGGVLTDAATTNEVEGDSPLLLGQDWLRYYKVNVDYG